MIYIFIKRIHFLGEETILKNNIKILFLVESMSCDTPIITYIKSSTLKMTKEIRKMCKCFTSTSDNPQENSNKQGIIDFNIDKVVRN